MRKILAAIRRAFLPADPTSVLRSPMAQDFIKLYWDTRQGMIECTYEGELEMFTWDIEWLRKTFAGQIPDTLLNQKLDDLDAIYRHRYTHLHGFAI